MAVRNKAGTYRVYMHRGIYYAGDKQDNSLLPSARFCFFATKL